MGEFQLCLVSERLIQWTFFQTVPLIVWLFVNNSFQCYHFWITPLIYWVLFCRYKDYREPPWSENKYDISKDFWAVLAARLAFVIVFQVGDTAGSWKKIIGPEKYLLSQLFPWKAKEICPSSSPSLSHPPRHWYILSGKIHPQGFPELVWCRT